MNADKINETAREVSKLGALLNDKHPNLISWQFIVQQQSIKVIDLLYDNIIQPDEGEEQNE